MSTDRNEGLTLGIHAPIFALIPGTRSADIADEIETRLAHLSAMLETTYGAGAEAFQGMSSDLQDNYLWACATLASECHELAGALASTIERREAPGCGSHAASPPTG